MRRDLLRFYVATRLENIDAADALSEKLRAEGWQHTYDWTITGRIYQPDQPPSSNLSRMAKTALAEIEGVKRADVLIVLLPGGRGTHVELGAALAFGVTVLLIGEKEPLTGECENGGYPCAFYRYPGVVWAQTLSDAWAFLDGYKANKQ